MNLDYKACPTEFKALEDQPGKYDGHFSVFGNVDDGGDITEQGAFAKTIRENGHRVKVFFAHDWMKPIGPPPSLLEEDSIGLHAAGKLTLDSFWGRETYALMKDGAITEGSFGYNTIKADIDSDGIRRLKEVKLYEISPVPLGMNALTSVQALKAAMTNMVSVMRPHQTPIAPSDTQWNGKSAEYAQLEPIHLKRLHAWMDPGGDPSQLESYRFLHHLPNGSLHVEGLKAAAAELAFDVELTPQDQKHVRAHLDAHFSQLGLPSPWGEAALKAKVDLLSHFLTEIKEGKALVTASPDQVKQLVEALEALTTDAKEVMAAAEPQSGLVKHSALLDTRMRAANLALAFTR